MSSQKTEKIHTILLRKILSDSGLECDRSLFVTPESSVIEEEGGEEALPEQESFVSPPPLVTPEEEPEKPEVKEEAGQTDGIFPTPSLRRLVPDRVRRMEAHNRIHVLPEEFRTDIDPQAIPKISITAQQTYIDVLAAMVGCTEYRSSLAEFWFLDTLANLLRRAQEDEMDRPGQAVLIRWWCEWMKEIQHFDAADRPRMMRRFKDNMLSAARFISEKSYLPTPDEAGVDYVDRNDTSTQDTRIRRRSNHPKGGGEPEVPAFEGTLSFECSLRDLTKILHYIFDLFSTDFQFDLVRSVFTFTPEYNLIDAPFHIENPKRNYQVSKGVGKKESKKSPKKGDAGKGKKKQPPPEPDNEEYLYLMAQKARELAEIEAREEVEFDQWLRKSRILPLNLAVNEQFLDKYWPPPPPPSPPEPEPEPVVQPKKKGKK